MTPQERGRPLRFRLFLLAASGLLPLAIVAAAMLGYLAGERGAMRRTALAVSRAWPRRSIRNCGPPSARCTSGAVR